MASLSLPQERSYQKRRTHIYITRWKWRTIQFRAKWSTVSSKRVDKWILRIIVVHLNSLLDNRELLEIMLYIIRLYEGIQVSKTLSVHALSLSLSVLLTIVARICVLYARWSLWNIVDKSEYEQVKLITIVSIVLASVIEGTRIVIVRACGVYTFVWVNFNFSIVDCSGRMDVCRDER